MPPELLRRIGYLALLLPVILLCSSVSRSSEKTHTFELGKSDFLLDGKPFQILSGEMHYARIPREYWRERLKMARAMGLNTISTYIFWNYHEREKGTFDFTTESRNVAEFVRLAQEEGLLVIIRPGPYVCAEWDFGGIPWWLLKGNTVKVRSRDPRFLAASKTYLTRLGEELAPLQISRGGPIIMVQVENEYGSYGNDTVYLNAIRDDLRNAGFTVPFYTADGPGQCRNGHIAGVLPAINGDEIPQSIRDTVNEWNDGRGPYFSPEFYPGWLDHWGEEHSVLTVNEFIGKYDTLLRSGISVSLYMFHGGTNFGFSSGANYGGHYQPQPTSYDYDAPLDEAGRPTPKYLRLREVLKNYQFESAPLPDIPPTPRVMEIPTIKLQDACTIFDTLPKPIHSVGTLPMEEIGQESGYILYRTQISGRGPDTLIVNGIRDYAVVMVDHKRVGSLDRRHKQKRITFSLSSDHAELDLLVEANGKINYGRELLENNKGIIGNVVLNRTPLKEWDMVPLPMDNPSTQSFFHRDIGNLPAFYRGTFVCDSAADTFLDLRGWTKGAVWINGHNLGRYWYIGPQQTLYCPGVWLRKGRNELIVFEMEKSTTRTITGLKEPTLNSLYPDLLAPPLPKRPQGKIELSNSDEIASGSFALGDSAQGFRFNTRSARYVCLESLSSLHNDPFASIAELYLLDEHGKKLDRSRWKIYFVDSEELHAEDGRAENVMDDDPETLWHTQWGAAQPPHPHQIAIDLGSVERIGGFVYQPRIGSSSGKIKDFMFYARLKEFPIQH